MATYPNVNAANQYARDIVGGKILACQLTVLACQRHLDDLERAKDPHWPYRFDKNKAERFLRFAQKMPHTSGEWARRKLRIEFEAWQKFALGVPFGWVHKKTGLRRFSEIYIEVPRKNGKSAIAAAVGNYMFCADGEHGAEVYCGATTEKQAWKVFSPALQMVKKLPALRQKFSIKPWAKKMTRPDGSVFAPVIGDPGDGDSPSCAIIDEYHEHTTDALYTTMTTGMGAREQPMTLIITTAGYDITSPCYEKRTQVVEILRRTRNGEENETIFGLIYGLDDDDDWTIVIHDTQKQYLDAKNFPDGNASADPTQEKRRLFFIDVKHYEDDEKVEFTLSSPFALQGMMIPTRQLHAICTWCIRNQYRSGNGCDYAGTRYFDRNNQPVDDPSQDVCNGTLTACKLRHGENSELPFGGFPGTSLIRS